MSKARKKGKGVTQASNRNTVSKSVEPLRPDSGSVKNPGRSTLESSGLDTPVGPHIPRMGHEQIAERANAIWVDRGRPQGQDQANWGEAEAQLRSEL